MRKRISFWWVLTNIIYNFFLINCDKNLSIISGAWLEGGGGGGGLPWPLLKIEEKKMS